jgi:hypothetical protein
VCIPEFQPPTVIRISKFIFGYLRHSRKVKKYRTTSVIVFIQADCKAADRLS